MVRATISQLPPYWRHFLATRHFRGNFSEKWEVEEVLELVGGEVGHVLSAHGEGNSGRGRR